MTSSDRPEPDSEPETEPSGAGDRGAYEAEPNWVVTQPTEEFLAALKGGVEEALKTAGPDFGKAVNDLAAAIDAVNRFELVQLMSMRYLVIAPGENPEFDRPDEIFQHHVELVQAFALREPLEKGAPAKDLLDGLKDIIDAAIRAVDASMFLEFLRVEKAKDDAERRRTMAISVLRLYGARVRGPTYYTHLVPALTELFVPLDQRIEEAIGVRAGALVDWWWAVSNAVQDRINAHRRLVHEISELPLDEKWAATIKELVQVVPYDLSDELRKALAADEKRRMVFAGQLGLRNQHLIYGFTLDYLVSLYPGDVEPDALLNVLRAWSLSFGETGQIKPQELITDNPVMSRPIIRLNERLYLWTIPAGFHHSAFTMLERLIQGNNDLLSAYHDRRGEYLEDAVASAFAEKFPSAKVLTNVYWTHPADGSEYQTDCIVLIDSTVLIAESKGGRFSSHAQRGKARPLRDDIQDLLVKPTEQSKRLADLLEQGDGKLELRPNDDDAIVVDIPKVEQVATLGVTLESIAAMLPGLSEVIEAGLTSGEYEALTYNLTLFNLQVIFEILEHPSDVITYLIRRSEIEADEFLHGEEADLLGPLSRQRLQPRPGRI